MDKFVTILITNQKRRIFFRAWLMGLSLLLFFPPLYANPSIEQKIKVAYIYNFTKFITWPQKPNDTFNLCVLGKDPFGALFNSLESKTAFGVPIKLIRLQKTDPSNHCQILFLGERLETNIIQSTPSIGILTVSEKTQFVQQEGIIGFIIKKGKVKLKININNAKQAGLIISAKLLEIADLVGEGEDG